MNNLEENKFVKKILDILSVMTEEQLNKCGYKSISMISSCDISPTFMITKNDDTHIQITTANEADEFISTLIF